MSLGSTNEWLLFYWGKGTLDRYIGGTFQRERKRGRYRIIEGVIREIHPSPSQPWRIIISGTLMPVQRIDPSDYSVVEFNKNGGLYLVNMFKDSVWLSPAPGWRKWISVRMQIPRKR